MIILALIFGLAVSFVLACLYYWAKGEQPWEEEMREILLKELMERD